MALCQDIQVCPARCFYGRVRDRFRSVVIRERSAGFRLRQGNGKRLVGLRSPLVCAFLLLRPILVPEFVPGRRIPWLAGSGETAAGVPAPDFSGAMPVRGSQCARYGLPGLRSMPRELAAGRIRFDRQKRGAQHALFLVRRGLRLLFRLACDPIGAGGSSGGAGRRRCSRTARLLGEGAGLGYRPDQAVDRTKEIVRP